MNYLQFSSNMQPSITMEEYFKMLVTKKHLKRIRAHYHQPNLTPKKLPSQSEDDIQIEKLEISDMLKTLSHQKKAMNEQKWSQMLQIHEKFSKPQYDYKFFLIITSQANYRKLDHPGYYKLLKNQINSYQPFFFSSIQKDIPRTLPDGHPFQDSLRKVLYCYAIRNPSLLYCQGMNYIVAFLLMNCFSEEEAFWFLVQLIQDIVMPDYFKNLSTISIAVQIFTNTLKQVFPQLAHEMEEVSMNSSIFLVGWYVCLFTKGFINSVSQYLLQKIVIETRKYSIGFVILKISLGIIATLLIGEMPLQFQKDFNSIKQSIEKNAYEISLDEIRKGISYLDFNYEVYQKIEAHYINKRNEAYQQEIKKELKEKKLSLPPCDLKAPICLHHTQIQKKIGTLQQVLILKPRKPIKEIILNEYFPSKINRQPTWFHFEKMEDCPVTYQTHICHLDKKTSQFNPQKGLSAQKSEYKPLRNQNSGEQVFSSRSKIQEIYSEYSEFFIVSEENDLTEQCEEDEEQQALEQSLEQNSPLVKNPFLRSIGKAFKKAVTGINLIKNDN